MKFDLREQSFSTYGSYLAFSYPFDQNSPFSQKVCLRILHGEFERQDMYPLLLEDESGSELPYEATGTPAECTLNAGERQLRFCYQDADNVHFTGNCGVQITKAELGGYNRAVYRREDLWELAGDTSSLMVIVRAGRVVNESVWSPRGTGDDAIRLRIVPDETGRVDFQVQRFDLTYRPKPYLPYEDNRAAKEQAFSQFLGQMPKLPEVYREAAELALYINWSSVVEPEGYVKAPAMLMTKSYMNFIWSWDYAFNALAMCQGWEQLAYDQFLAMVHVQDEDGAYPDCFNARKLIRGFVKPPVQGFILDRMLEFAVPPQEVLETLYGSVSRLTRWWLDFRTGEDGLPLYHHGNDSGWDNGTAFAAGVPIQSPDLCTWLILQMDFLKRMALQLGKPDEADEWNAKADSLLAAMLDVLVEGDRFTALKVPENIRTGSNSLLLFVPLLLGERLPEELRRSMLEDLLSPGRFQTAFGFASEAVDSVYFVEDGYWRGAVWPPLAYILSEILRINGREQEARENARTFCDNCVRAGFAENYSALDGHPLRDNGYTWTTSVFLIFARDYLAD
ncbi:MGH1-like glycoside hydrolase domain-containing protein [Paenibacillus physcomitrellae]|uniref:Mannosylglycerate hydrolase MGH1-like glycoside hydrolase domain-containing protein n=1 Tax=Paenibacillus physcomitrellae TaxID=1619311 RepID=A0ABQ1GRF2_9BACL|nr:hypothetical protein [Paenibacillus physcomitrellae]GGA48503.1 hypothetical protein GCM10010917_37280 [Paenibacillus physcomitrellae]